MMKKIFLALVATICMASTQICAVPNLRKFCENLRIYVSNNVTRENAWSAAGWAALGGIGALALVHTSGSLNQVQKLGAASVYACKALLSSACTGLGIGTAISAIAGINSLAQNIRYRDITQDKSDKRNLLKNIGVLQAIKNGVVYQSPMADVDTAGKKAAILQETNKLITNLINKRQSLAYKLGIRIASVTGRTKLTEWLCKDPLITAAEKLQKATVGSTFNAAMITQEDFNIICNNINYSILTMFI